ncbi:MAG: cadherin-like beta sandwich domain-containing protein [Kofleriaceae bacterium]|nr:cadherin-like beta sandwich domain-containing protein [Myxococcales bacterium]MCB9559897.1 cadherin-like beta sandwich domain-containing protein [Kofleriaceae bacterium]MCB9571511.1 cadherin-like beta sandwich domain-containing protein [Kofleriaceae bacterium]
MERNAFRAVIVIVTCSVGGCFEKPADVEWDAAPVQGRVGGTLVGMWDGASIQLRLQAGQLDTTLDVDHSGSFQFPDVLEAGAPYTVTIATEPVAHECVVAAGDGTINGDVDRVEVTCSGPSVEVSLSLPTPWTFTPDELQQTVGVSWLAQQTRLTVVAPDATEIRIGGALASSGTVTAPYALAPGDNAFNIDVRVGTLSRSYELTVNRGSEAIEHFAYAKASNVGDGDHFGAVAISGDTLVVGAPNEDSSATGVNGDQGNDNSPDSGAVYVFRRTGPVWHQEAYLKASNRGGQDHFGSAVAISGDTIVVGAPAEDSDAVVVNGSSGDVSVDFNSGAAYVFGRVGTTWSQRAYLKPSNSGMGDNFGFAVAISGDSIVVGAPFEDGPSNSSQDAGAAYVFRRNGTAWSQEGIVRAGNPGPGDSLGYSVAISQDLVVAGALGEDSNVTGVDGTPNELSSQSGAAYLFRRVAGVWSQEAFLKASNPSTFAFFGNCVGVSGDAVAVGAPGESGGAPGSGAVYIFRRSGGAWAQEAYLKPDTVLPNAFGTVLSLAGDVLLVGAPSDGTDGMGVDPTSAGTSADSGASYVFRAAAGSWDQVARLKSSNTSGGDTFGAVVAVGEDTIACGAWYEDGGSPGIDGNQADDTAADSGAAYVLR